jgi:tRNA(Arg) A34 adenosine deaminase TadA
MLGVHPMLLTPPDWLSNLTARGLALPREEDRLAFVIELSHRNVVERTGGPFGAAIFEVETGALVGAGVNRVETLRSSIAHAEVLAIAAADEKLGAFDLGAPGLGRHELVSSAQPCLMCAGALLWSGVTRIVYAAHKDDVERLVGFDEGPAGWVDAFRSRGIGVASASEELRVRACAVLERYRTSGGLFYGSRRAP